MTKIKAILVDDESRARNVLNSLLKRNCPEVELVASCENVLEAVEQIKLLKPDLVFLDIQMPQYYGYELMSFFQKIEFEIIFVTAYDQYAIKAFELCATDYLLKPVNREKLKTAVKKVAKKLSLKEERRNYKALIETLQDDKHSQIVISQTEGNVVVKFKNLIAIEASGSYCILYLNDNTKIIASKNLKHFQDLLDEVKCFYRCHKSWIVNLKKVISFENLNIILENNLPVKVSKLKTIEVKELLKM